MVALGLEYGREDKVDVETCRREKMVLVDFVLTPMPSFNDIKTWYSLIELTVSFGNGSESRSIQPKK